METYTITYNLNGENVTEIVTSIKELDIRTSYLWSNSVQINITSGSNA
jgi:hypothetical protein